MANDDLYSLLQVRSNASKEVIEAAYEALMQQEHPEKGQRSLLNYRVKLGVAKDILTDAGKREKYDLEYFSKAPETIGDYTIVEQIAQGSFGKTYKAEHKLTGAPAAIKHSMYISPQREEMLKKEAKILTQMRHHAIPAFYNLMQLDDGSYALASSFIEGQTLEHMVAESGGLEPETACWVTQRVLDGLRYLHYHGVIHGDVSPQNILIQPEEHTICLVDYGLSQIGLTKSNTGHTKNFASPEQIAGETLLPESDFYSLGMTMIYALGGDVENKRIPADTPDEVCDYISKMIAQDPLGRPNWQEHDLIDSLLDVREKAFGRRHTNHIRLPKGGDT